MVIGRNWASKLCAAYQPGKPAEIAATEGNGFPVRTLALSRLEVTAVPVLICRDSVAR
ncbi:MAG: hypothetical protein V7K48_07640 [Nostoc sp.]|uniref:hypothetical protein n=1 Tax=Nostoc sp. TaxID=1180 RepID=UPI002FF55F93